MVNRVTKKWIRNEADEYAAANGYFMEEERGEHVCNFIENQLCLYEGDYAGKPIRLMDWQVDMFYRLFGWVSHSEFYDRTIRRFKIASVWLPKKNGKSPTGACVGLYLMAADGEQGQHIYSCARDAKQARIVHKNACMMVEQSPALSQVCMINNSTGVISYEPTFSNYSIVAGSNHQSLEGLNGCTIVDEVHVIDSRTAHAIEHAGISRSEWMRFEISTAGSNLNGYGWQQWQYGEKVNRGEIKDPEFFFLKYAADSKLTDEQLEDPKVWREANPSMGTIISEAEFAKSLTRAKRSLVDWQNFKKYRLNIWSESDSPWLNKVDWDKCHVAFNEEDYYGRECIGGLDLSRTRDMTAFVLVFDEGDGTFACLPYFWYPESAARKNDHQTPYLEWANQGYVDLIPGDVIKYDVVEDAICELAEKFIITEIVYDRLFAEDVTLRIENRVGCLRTNFPQTVMHFAGPTAETERLVTAGDLRHNNNPVLNWQAQNVKVKSDVNNNLRPVKPKNNNPAKIDGMVALIMAIGRSIAESEPEITYDFYDHNEVELI
jgi:phage terminase large subunit-like protein